MNTPIKFTTAEEAVKVIKSGDHVHLSSVASAPQCLIKAMCARGEAGELKNVHVHHLHTEGPAPYADPKFEGVFQLDSLFVGASNRSTLPERRSARRRNPCWFSATTANPSIPCKSFSRTSSQKAVGNSAFASLTRSCSPSIRHGGTSAAAPDRTAQAKSRKSHASLLGNN